MDDSEEMGSVLEAASTVFSMRNSKFGFRSAVTAHLIKRVSTEVKIDRTMTDDFEGNGKKRLPPSTLFSMRNSKFGFRNAGTAHLIKRVSTEVKIDGTMTDDFEGNGKKRFGYGYEVGDMVWGKVQSYPWWPGQVFDEAFAVHSVCETKKEGHVLVAFFGDGSYGWFNPKHLLPFDSHYFEKSKQVGAQTFVSAVMDAEDEVCRRAALGLVCRCRKASNFQPMCVRGFYAVDVGGYGPSVVYTSKEIRKVRCEFHPLGMLSFVQKLALTSHGKLQGNLDWIRNAARFLAYRMAVFKEVEETYSQAFEIGRVCPASSNRVSNQPEIQVAATLNGSLLIAGAFGRKAPSSIRVQRKRDNEYLLNLIDDPNNLDREHILEGKDPPFSMNTEFTGQDDGTDKVSKVCTALNSRLAGKKIETMDRKGVHGQICSENAIFDREPNRNSLLDCSQGSQLPRPRFLKTAENHNGRENMYMAGRITYLLDTVHPGKVLCTRSYNTDENPKAQKHSGEDFCSEEDVAVDVKKQKKRESNLEAGTEPPYRLLKPAKVEARARQSAGKSGQTGLVHGKVSLMDKTRKEKGIFRAITSGSEARQKMSSTRYVGTGLPQSISDLSGLALDPFHGVEQNIPTNESLPLRSAWDPTFSSKSSKKRLRSTDYVKAGCIGHIFDCGEEMSPDGPKHRNDLKSLTAEKKASHLKPVKLHSRDWREIELKAKFARYGPLDHSATRVFWKASKCQVVFKRKSDAQEAYEHAQRSSSLFGTIKVCYQLQTLGSLAPELSKLGNPLVKEAPAKFRKLTTLSNRNSSESKHQPKSCLKKPSGSEVRSTRCVSSKTAHVEIILGGDESSGRGQLLIGSNIKNVDDDHPGGSSSSPSATSKVTYRKSLNGRHVPLHPSVRPLNQIFNVLDSYEVDRVIKACNLQYRQVDEARSNRIYPSSSIQSVDISHQMLNLLTRCNEIVNELKCTLGSSAFT
ncbi:hypothetical protein CJ030_MR5G017278 [Morella rubra]|uniref:PWWP domain-containing protein n=1 Tax=Morella rubra TaxID=262757 RepID=A0A6A1VMY2_9ROSI|nr:hypothetical protein CJ030_MR5G017278 [Morella rubra]